MNGSYFKSIFFLLFIMIASVAAVGAFERYYSADRAHKAGKTVYVGTVNSRQLVNNRTTAVAESTVISGTNSVFGPVTNTFYTGHMNGNFSGIINVDSVDGGGVQMRYMVSPDGTTWFTPDSSTLMDRVSTVTTEVEEISLIPSPYVKIIFDVTPTIQFDAYIMGN